METEVYQQLHQLERGHWWFRGMYGLCADILKRYLGPNPSGLRPEVLDLGCGTGLWPRYLLSFGNVTALDRSSEALAICRQRQLPHLIQGDAQNLPIADNSCDLVTALALIEHLDDDRALVKELQRILKPGGHALLLTSAYMFLWSAHDNSAHHRRRYTQGCLAKMVKEAGLEPAKISYVNSFLFLPILLVRLSRRLHAAKDKKTGASGDLFIPAQFLNRFFYALLRIESYLLKYISMPFGVGLVLLVRKPKG